jgi:hypothetical protein
VLGGVLKCKLLPDPAGLGGGEGLVPARPSLRVQVIWDSADLLGLGVRPIHQLPAAFSIVTPRAACGHRDVPPAPPRFTSQHLVTNALALIFLIDAGWPAGARPLGRTYLADQLLARFSAAHNGGAWLVRP